MIKMIATKPLKYATRRLLPDDDFTARSESHARVLEATKRARRAPEKAVERFVAPKVERPAPAYTPTPSMAPVPSLQAGPVDERPALRAEYQAKLGKAPFPGWSADVLREKIAAAGEDDA